MRRFYIHDEPGLDILAEEAERRERPHICPDCGGVAGCRSPNCPGLHLEARNPSDEDEE